jgi:hypothetical protein
LREGFVEAAGYMNEPLIGGSDEPGFSSSAFPLAFAGQNDIFSGRSDHHKIRDTEAGAPRCRVSVARNSKAHD